jgi:hypothetical protein
MEKNMISQEKARSLLKTYGMHLNVFQNLITQNDQHLLRCDVQIIPNVMDALKAIATKSKFTPQVKNSGMSSLRVLSTNPQEALKELLVNEYYHNHFQDMCSHYLGNKPNLLINLKKFHNTMCQEITPVSTKNSFFDNTVKNSNQPIMSNQRESRLNP